MVLENNEFRSVEEKKNTDAENPTARIEDHEDERQKEADADADEENQTNDGNGMKGMDDDVARFEDHEDEQQKDAGAKLNIKNGSDPLSSTKVVAAGKNVDPLQALEEGKIIIDVDDKLEDVDLEPVLTCPICLNDITEQEEIQRLASCGHLFCIGCLRDYAKNEVSQNRILKCPRFAECHKFLSQEICNEILSGEESTAYQQIVNRDSLVCPKCSVRQPHDRSTDHSTTSGIVRCVECGACFCSIHGDSHKATLSACREYVRKQERASERLIHRQTKPCPGCNVLVVRDGGCNHMVCSLCNFGWCWDCGQNQRLCRCGPWWLPSCIASAPFLEPAFWILIFLLVLIYTAVVGLIAIATFCFGLAFSKGKDNCVWDLAVTPLAVFFEDLNHHHRNPEEHRGYKILYVTCKAIAYAFLLPVFCIGLLIATALLLVYTLLAGLVALVTAGFGFGCFCGLLYAEDDTSGFSLVKEIVFGPLWYFFYDSYEFYEIATD